VHGASKILLKPGRLEKYSDTYINTNTIQYKRVNRGDIIATENIQRNVKQYIKDRKCTECPKFSLNQGILESMLYQYEYNTI